MIRIYKTDKGIVIEGEGRAVQSTATDWDELINRSELFAAVQQELVLMPQLAENWREERTILAPIGTQEVWAAGVTYLRSKEARMEESESSGASSFYDKVYAAERPELFFKAASWRVIPPGGTVRIRKDSHWNVPEPELTLVVNSAGAIVGYTIGNDMSSRSIEGENPLYLPQAKIYDGSASIGQAVTVTEEPLRSSTGIHMTVSRSGKTIFTGSTTLSQMKRRPEELVEFLYRECSFPAGCYLMTGTSVVPDADFTLQEGDSITMEIDGLGTLSNVVA